MRGACWQSLHITSPAAATATTSPLLQQPRFTDLATPATTKGLPPPSPPPPQATSGSDSEDDSDDELAYEMRMEADLDRSYTDYLERQGGGPGQGCWWCWW